MFGSMREDNLLSPFVPQKKRIETNDFYPVFVSKKIQKQTNQIFYVSKNERSVAEGDNGYQEEHLVHVLSRITRITDRYASIDARDRSSGSMRRINREKGGLWYI